MKVKDIVPRVRKAIDMMTASDSEFEHKTSDDENLTDVIIDKIPYALTYVIENAPEEKLDSGMVSALEIPAAEPPGTVAGGMVSALEIPAAEPPGTVAGGMVSVKLPTDLLRVVSARLTSWPLSPTPVSENSQEYLMQQDEYARGSWDRPVSAIRYRGAERYLELYSAKDSEDVPEVSYIKKPDAGDTSDPETDVGVPSLLEGAFIYQVAGLTMTAFREEVSVQLFKIAQSYLFSSNNN